MFYLVCYDTPSNRRRRRLAKTLADYATRVQKSVFETYLPGEAREEMLDRIRKILDEDEDSLRIYPMHRDGLKAILVFGRPSLTELDGFFWVGDGKLQRGSTEE